MPCCAAAAGVRGTLSTVSMGSCGLVWGRPVASSISSQATKPSASAANPNNAEYFMKWCYSLFISVCGSRLPHTESRIYTYFLLESGCVGELGEVECHSHFSALACHVAAAKLKSVDGSAKVEIP